MGRTKNVAGIDLGTTNSCVAVYSNNRVEIVRDEQNKRTFASCVGFVDTGRVYGDYAKKQLAVNYKNTVYDAKRLIGHTFNDPVVQEDMKNWPFTIVPGSNGSPMFQVQFRGKTETFYPEQISSFILENLVEKASKFADRDIDNVVITVPAHFNNSQRKATIDAGNIAGFTVLGVLNEPTAAAIAYGFENQNSDKRILVYDLGGGTFDVTLLHLHDNNYDVIGTDGDTHLGGDDLDIILTRMLIRIARENGKNINEDDKRIMSKIRRKAEEVKIDLSTVTETELDDEWLCEEPFTITRDEFIAEASEFFNTTMTITNRLLTSTNVAAEQIDDVVLIGGSSRIPYVKELLCQKFGDHKIYSTINPDEAVAKGACIYAVKLLGDAADDSDSSSESESEDAGDSPIYTPVNIGEITIRDVIPLSIGVKNSEHMLSKILEKNTPYGVSNYREYQTSKDYQKRMKIHVAQGERARYEDNYEIGTMIFNFPPLARGEVIVRIELSTDSNGVLTVHVSDNLGNDSVEHVFETKSTNLSNDDIIEMKKKADEFKREDELARKRASVRSNIKARVYEIERIAGEIPDLDQEYHENLLLFLEDIHGVLKSRDLPLEQLEDFKANAEEWYASLTEPIEFFVCWKQ